MIRFFTATLALIAGPVFAQPQCQFYLANQAGGNAASLKDLLELCVAEGFLVPVSEAIYLHAEAEADMRRLVVERVAVFPQRGRSFE